MAIIVCDVGPRDGLQNEAEVLAPAVRAELVRRLAAAGLPRIEAVSFVNPRRVPAMAGAEEVVAGLPDDVAAQCAGLALNHRGYERLRATPLHRVHVAFAVTETFNQRNQGASPAESLAMSAAVARRARADGRDASVTFGAAFGCPFEGDVDPGYVAELAARAVDAGVDELVFADTIGTATPGRVAALVSRTVGLGARIGVHLHNTRNTGYANAWAALGAGARVLDASVGGLGGCPFAPRATGNIATEDLLYMLEREGIATGIDATALLETSAWLAGVMARELPAQLGRAGWFPPRAHGPAAAAISK